MINTAEKLTGRNLAGNYENLKSLMWCTEEVLGLSFAHTRAGRKEMRPLGGLEPV
jgi:hypothetical protein